METSPAVVALLAVIGVIGLALLGCVVVINAVRRTETRLRLGNVESAQEEFRVDLRKIKDDQNTIWRALFSRGEVKGHTEGLGKMGSPLHATQSGLELFPLRLRQDLQDWYAGLPNHESISRPDLGLMIVKEFDDRIIREVCLPYGVDSMVCIALAVDIATLPPDMVNA